MSVNEKFIIDFYHPVINTGYGKVLLLTGFKVEQLTNNIRSYTLMIFGLRLLVYTENKIA